MKLLLVDDDADDRTFFCDALGLIDSTIECEIAVDGMDALKKLRTTAQLPDAIFMDVNMPLMDGRECVEKLRADSRLKHIRVVMLSTSSSLRDVSRFELLGATYMVKPSDFNQLVRTLRTFISRVPVAAMLLSNF